MLVATASRSASSCSSWSARACRNSNSPAGFRPPRSESASPASSNVIWFANFPSVEGLVNQAGAAALVLGAYYSSGPSPTKSADRGEHRSLRPPRRTPDSARAGVDESRLERAQCVQTGTGPDPHKDGAPAAVAGSGSTEQTDDAPAPLVAIVAAHLPPASMKAMVLV